MSIPGRNHPLLMALALTLTTTMRMKIFLRVSLPLWTNTKRTVTVTHQVAELILDTSDALFGVGDGGSVADYLNGSLGSLSHPSMLVVAADLSECVQLPATTKNGKGNRGFRFRGTISNHVKSTPLMVTAVA